MADKNSFARLYLLRPLRALEEVLGGRSGVVRPGAQGITARGPVPETTDN